MKQLQLREAQHKGGKTDGIKMQWNRGQRDGRVVTGAKNKISFPFFFPHLSLRLFHQSWLSVFFSCFVHHVRPLWLWISQTVTQWSSRSSPVRVALWGRHHVWVVLCNLATAVSHSDSRESPLFAVIFRVPGWIFGVKNGAKMIIWSQNLIWL